MSTFKTIFSIFFISTALLSADLRKIARIYQPNFTHMVGDGFRVHNYFPEDQTPLSLFSPFVLLDYNAPHYFAPLKNGKRGVGAHPHRGFETVTFVYDGKVAHRDSAGNNGVIGANDVQWMTAGSGVLHEEFHDASFAKSGGEFHAVQLWVNLPKKSKMSPPKYQTLLDADMKKVILDQKGSVLRVIAGSYQDQTGPASTFTPIKVYDVTLKEKSSLTLNLPQDFNSMILVMQGSFEINGEKAKNKDLVLFDNVGEEIEIKATSDSFFLVLSGKPIDEPVIQSGPFVMNTEKEIRQAHRDYELGKFGYLSEEL